MMQKRSLRNMTLDDFERNKDKFPHHDTRVFEMKFKDVEHFSRSYPDLYNLYYPASSHAEIMPFDLVMKILPEPASRIYSGQKKYELRKYVPKHTGLMFLIETGGVDSITGCIVFEKFLIDKVANLWRTVGEQSTSKTRFDRYFEGKKFGVALEIGAFQRFKRSIKVSDLYHAFPDMPALPHPFVYLYTPKGGKLSLYLRKHAEEIIDRHGLR